MAPSKLVLFEMLTCEFSLELLFSLRQDDCSLGSKLEQQGEKH